MLKNKILRIFVFIVLWFLWIFPEIAEAQESGPDYAGITGLFIACAGAALVAPFLFWISDAAGTIGGGKQEILGTLSITLPIGFAFYLIMGLLQHLAVLGFGGAFWYEDCKNWNYFSKNSR